MEEIKNYNNLKNMLCNVSSMKQDIYHNSKQIFEIFKLKSKEIITKIKNGICDLDNRIKLEYIEKGEYEFQIIIAGDLLIFQLHTNVFKIDDTSHFWKSTYLKNNPSNSYCSIINIYNFLADSFTYNRVRDIGYLISRVMINREKHFYTEGKRQMGFLYSDFSNQIIDEIYIEKILYNVFNYAIEFDLLIPKYNDIHEISMFEAKSIGDEIQIKTGKRMGFRFSYEDN